MIRMWLQIAVLFVSVVIAACSEKSGDAADSGTDADSDGDSDTDSDSDTDGDTDTDTDAGPFSFVVFGDLNGGGCDKNERFHRLVDRMTQVDASFFLHTGDIIDGYGDTSCFDTLPSSTECIGQEESGNMAEQFAPLMEAGAPDGLNASFFPAIGNHDGNWGSGWYPDPCGDGICDFIGMDTTEVESVYLNHGDTFNAPGFNQHNLNHGDICSLDESNSGHPSDFYYSFAYRNSYFIVLALSEDDYGMLNCNGHPTAYDSCEEYCTDPNMYLDSERNDSCYSVYQWDWLVNELQNAAGTYDHIFVFAHAPLLSSGENHGATAGAEYYRTLLENNGVKAYFNGHNHAYERSYPISGDQITDIDNGTVYITTGTAGALTDTITTDWFTEYSYLDWTTYGEYEEMSAFLTVEVDGPEISVEVQTLSGNIADQFFL